jgi:hypothetical protein
MLASVPVLAPLCQHLDNEVDDDMLGRFEEEILTETLKLGSLLIPFLACQAFFHVILDYWTTSRIQPRQGLEFVYRIALCIISALLESKPFSSEQGNRRVRIIFMSILPTFAFWLNLLPPYVSSYTLNAHRMFLGKYIFLTFVFATLYYLPVVNFLVCITLQSFVLWIIWHWRMDYLGYQQLVYGIGLPVMTFLFYLVHRRRNLGIFMKVEQEKRARHLSDALQDTLRRVLNVTFDASCECDDTGCVVRSSQHLEELLDRSAEEFVHTDLKQLAANRAESKRVDTFFKQILMHDENDQQPLAMLETMFSRSGTKDASKVDVVKVKLCCVPLPVQCSSLHGTTVGNDRRLFVGLQRVHGPDGSNSDGHKNQSQSNSAAGSDHGAVAWDLPKVEELRSQCPIPCGSDAGSLQSSIGESGSEHRKGEARCRRGGGSVPIYSSQSVFNSDQTSDMPRLGAAANLSLLSQSFLSHGGGGFSAPMASSLQEPWHAVFDDAASLTSFSYSGTLCSQSLFDGPVTMDVFTQTDIVSKVPTFTQTELEPLKIASRASSQPGCPPRPAIEVDAQTHQRFQQRRRRTIRKSPHFGKPYIDGFQCTPVKSVEYLMHEHLLMTNPLGSGCCFWHVGLSFFQGVIQEMLSSNCNLKIHPHQGWQCQYCATLHADSDDESDEEDGEHVRECEVCGYKQKDVGDDKKSVASNSDDMPSGASLADASVDAVSESDGDWN